MRSGSVSTPSRFHTIASARLETRISELVAENGRLGLWRAGRLGPNDPGAGRIQAHRRRVLRPGSRCRHARGNRALEHPLARDPAVARKRDVAGVGGASAPVTVNERATVTETGTVGVPMSDSAARAAASRVRQRPSRRAHPGAGR